MKKGILLLNLGSPREPSVPAIREYLAEFLMDPYVLMMPSVLRALLVYGIILPFRPQKTLKNYLSIWTNEGSPLIVETKKLAHKMQKNNPEAQIEYAMRYGSPNFESALDSFRKNNIQDIQVVPLYPQYALSTTVTSQVRLQFLNDKIYNKYFKFSFVKDFYNHPAFIDALAQKVKTTLDSQKWDHLIVSFHGLPKNHLGQKVQATNCNFNDCCNAITKENENCYRAQCFETARLVCKNLGLTQEQYTVSFQSRLTRGWIEPFTDVIIEDLPKKGIERIAIFCPSFVSDCLETLEEVKIGERERFLKAGGKEFHYIGCLNDDDSWVRGLSQIVYN